MRDLKTIFRAENLAEIKSLTFKTKIINTYMS